MATANCKVAIEDALGRPITYDEMEAIATEFNARVKAKLDLGIPKGTAVRQAGQEASDAAKFRAAQARERAYRTALTRAMRAERGSDSTAEISTVSPVILSTRKDAATTVGTIHDSLLRSVVYKVNDAIDKLKLRSIAMSRDPAQQLRIRQEIWRLGGDETVRPTGDKNAEALGKIFADAFEESRQMQNAEGAYITKKEGYSGRQIWDRLLTRGTGDGSPAATEASFQEWRKTFGPQNRKASDFEGLNAEQIESLLRAQHLSIATGRFGNAGSVTEGGAFNLASKIAQERTINFRTPELEQAAVSKYSGVGSIGEGVYAQLDAGARNAALMRMFGPTPATEALNWHQQHLDAAKAAGDLALYDKIKGNHFPSMFRLASGINDQETNHTIQSLSANWRALEQMRALGQLFFGGRALIHTGLAAMTLSRADTNFATALARMVVAAFPGGGASREMASAVQAGLDGMIHGPIRQFHEGGAGRLTGTVNQFYRLNGFGGLMDRVRGATAVGLTHAMGINAGKELAALSPRWQNDLLRYGIESSDWDAARAAAAKAADGRMHLIPSAIEDGKVRAKFQNYISGEVAQAANDPTIWSRDLANAHTQAGTTAGEIMRLITQFKSFPISMMQRQWGTQFRGGVNVPGILQLAGLSIGFGYLSTVLTGVINNEKTALPTDTAGWLGLATHSAIAGGALGLVSDAFLRDGIKSSSDWVKMAAGPTFGGILADTGAFLNVPGMVAGAQSRGGLTAHLLAGAKAVGADVTPNFWATSAAYNYLAPYMIANWLHPGAVQRHERAMQRNGQSWVLPPAN